MCCINHVLTKTTTQPDQTNSLVLVNVGGLDIVDKNKKLILAIVWQVCVCVCVCVCVWSPGSSGWPIPAITTSPLVYRTPANRYARIHVNL
jgi:hypothetical protein